MVLRPLELQPAAAAGVYGMPARRRCYGLAFMGGGGSPWYYVGEKGRVQDGRRHGSLWVNSLGLAPACADPPGCSACPMLMVHVGGWVGGWVGGVEGSGGMK